MKIRLAIRGFAGQAKLFDDRVSVEDAQLESIIPGLAMKHGTALADHRLHMIEIEFLDEADPRQRFFRFGTDPAGMVAPLRIDLGGVN